MMATFRWKPLQEYSAFGQLLATFMWEQRPPLNPAQFANMTGIDYLTVYRWFANNATPDPAHLLRIAQSMPLSVQTLFVAAGYGSESYPLFSLAEAWDHIHNCVMHATSVSADDQAVTLRVLQTLQAEDVGRHTLHGDETMKPDLEFIDHE